jgi:hypothetical protein
VWVDDLGEKDVICCLGLFAGVYVGSMLGGPWTFIAPILGFGLGLVGDSKLMGGRSCHQRAMEMPTDSRTHESEDREDQDVVIYPHYPGATGPRGHPLPADHLAYPSGPVLQAGAEGEGR